MDTFTHPATPEVTGDLGRHLSGGGLSQSDTHQRSQFSRQYVAPTFQKKYQAPFRCQVGHPNNGGAQSHRRLLKILACVSTLLLEAAHWSPCGLLQGEFHLYSPFLRCTRPHWLSKAPASSWKYRDARPEPGSGPLPSPATTAAGWSGRILGLLHFIWRHTARESESDKPSCLGCQSSLSGSGQPR